MSDTIIAIDLGRYKSVACVYHRATRGHEFRTPDTTPADLDKLFARHPGGVVVIEACANAGWAHDRAVAAGHAVKVANTAAASWTFQHLTRKTDHDDAKRLAELEAIGQRPTVALPDPATRQRRMLIAARQELVGQRVACQNRIRALFAGQGLPTPSGARAWTVAGLAGIEAQSKALSACAPDELWKGMLHLAVARYRSLVEQITQTEQRLDALSATDPATRLLGTIPGMGPRKRCRPTWATPTGSRRPNRSARTRGWCPSSTRAGSRTGRGGSRDAAPACCGSCWWSARGACCGTTRGREPSTRG